MPSTGFVASPVLHVNGSLSSVRTLRCPAAVRPRAARRPARLVALGSAPSPQQPPVPEDVPDDVESDSVPESASVSGSNSVPESTSPVEEITAEDILSSPAFLKKKLEVIVKELNEAKAAVDAAEEALASEKDSFVRLAADFENYRRRTSQDLRAQEAKSTAKVCREILIVLDNFERAIEAVKPDTDKERAINSSYQVINKQLLDALVKLNVTPLEAIGQPFDPELHEAIQKAESSEHVDGVVCAQFQRGYVIGESLIRPAVVAVSSGPGPAASDDDSDEPEGVSESDAE